MSYTISQLCTDAAETAEGVTGLKLVAWPPPDKLPAFGPYAYLEYGGAVIEQASDEVVTHTLTFTVLMPMKGNFAALNGEYVQVVETALLIHRAFYANTIIAGEAALASNATISKPDLYQFMETRHVRCILTIECVTSEDVASQVSD